MQCQQQDQIKKNSVKDVNGNVFYTRGTIRERDKRVCFY